MSSIVKWCHENDDFFQNIRPNEMMTPTMEMRFSEHQNISTIRTVIERRAVTVLLTAAARQLAAAVARQLAARQLTVAVHQLVAVQ